MLYELTFGIDKKQKTMHLLVCFVREQFLSSVLLTDYFYPSESQTSIRETQINIAIQSKRGRLYKYYLYGLHFYLKSTRLGGLKFNLCITQLYLFF